MFLSEPSRSQYDVNFRFLGFPVRISPYFWLIVLLMGASARSAQALLLWGIAVFVGILVHELGHALALRRYGFTPEIILYGGGGLTTFNAHLISNRVFLTRWDSIFISAAGPLAGFLLFGALCLFLQLVGINPFNFLWGQATSEDVSILRVFSAPFVNLLRMEMYICFFWGIINLMPVFPLDGGQIARELFLLKNSRTGIEQSLKLSFLTAVGLAIAAVLYDELFLGVFFAFFAYNSWLMMNRW